jgi:hypothetical protein
MTTNLTSSRLNRRPRVSIALAAALTLINAGAALTAAQRPGELAAQVSLSAPFEVITGALWACGFAWLGVRLWRRERRARPVFGWALIAWIGYSLVRVHVFARADYDRERLPFLFAAGVIACLLILFFVIRPRHAGAVHTETPKHDRPEN